MSVVRTLVERLFGWLESKVDPFPADMPERPPERFWGFVRHYTWPFRWLILAGAVSAALVAVVEVSLFRFLGTLVDWLGEAER